MGQFQAPITIKDAIDNIASRKYLLPAIQRKFVWSSEQIEMLFDSIMRGYPINSLMLWEVKDNNVKSSFRFYEFLSNYREWYNTENPYVDTSANQDFFAVIDGQQRLTSLYLGLKGSYAYKIPYRRWEDSERSIPTRHLYLDLAKPLEDEDSGMYYNFKFLTKEEFERDSASSSHSWFKVHDILDNNVTIWNVMQTFAKNNKQVDNFALNTFELLYRKIFYDHIINYYSEDSQNIDRMLDIFIRTNSGGEPLSFSNLLMSITTANWENRDARDDFHKLIQRVYNQGKPGFMISGDFILKTCLVLFNDQIQFKVANFNREIVKQFEWNWDKISHCIIQTFKLLELWGFNESNLRAKNAAIPIIYYIYYNNLEDIITKENEIKRFESIRQWLCLSLLKRVFSGQSDNVLSKIRNVLKDSMDNNIHEFPLSAIKEAFKDDPNKNLSFDDEFIESLLSTQMDDSNCYIVLSILYSHLNFGVQEFDKDHLHPANYFNNLNKEDFKNEEDFEFYADYGNWNSILNLQLLNSYMNKSKQDMPLKDWVTVNNIDLQNQLIPNNTDLSIENFKEFIEKRKTLLVERFKQMTGTK